MVKNSFKVQRSVVSTGEKRLIKHIRSTISQTNVDGVTTMADLPGDQDLELMIASEEMRIYVYFSGNKILTDHSNVLGFVKVVDTSIEWDKIPQNQMQQLKVRGLPRKWIDVGSWWVSRAHSVANIDRTSKEEGLKYKMYEDLCRSAYLEDVLENCVDNLGMVVAFRLIRSSNSHPLREVILDNRFPGQITLLEVIIDKDGQYQLNTEANYPNSSSAIDGEASAIWEGLTGTQKEAFVAIVFSIVAIVEDVNESGYSSYAFYRRVTGKGGGEALSMNIPLKQATKILTLLKAKEIDLVASDVFDWLRSYKTY